MTLHTAYTTGIGARRWIGLCAVIAVLDATSIANAQGCECTCLGRFYQSGSEQGAPFGPFAVSDQVPSNARIFAWLAEYDRSTVRLSRGDRDIPIVLEAAAPDVLGAYWVVPTEPIEPPGLYTLSVSGPSPTGSYTTSFNALGSPDSRAPVTGEARAVPLRDHDYCADIVGTGFDLDLEAEPGAVVYEVEVLRGGEIVAHTFTRGAFGTSSDSDCFGNVHVDGLMEGEHLTARVRAWDQAGNASEFVAFSFTPRRALAGSDQPCGRCSVTAVGSPAPIPTWVVGLALIGIGTFCGRRTGGGVSRSTPGRGG